MGRRLLTTLLAAAGDTTVKEDLLKGRKVGDKTFKVHLDGYNLLPALKGEAEWPRHDFLYWTDDGNVAAVRYNNWKITFLRQNAEGIDVWRKPFEELRAPMITNLRMDPFERAEYESIGYDHWWTEHMFIFAPAGAYVGKWLQSFREPKARATSNGSPSSYYQTVSADGVTPSLNRGAISPYNI